MNDPSNEAERRLRLIARVALLCAVLMLATIGLSAFLRLSAQAGPADGHAIAAARLVHRVVASAALLGAALMVMTLASYRARLRLEWALSVALFVVMLALALLGALARASAVPAVVLGNLLGGFVALALSWRLARPGVGDTLPRAARALAGVAVALLLAQVMLGALVSGSGSARACTAWADCWSVVEGGPVAVPDLWRRPAPAANPDPAGALVQIAHRAGAWVALPAVALLGALAWRRRATAAALLLLAATQAVLGPLAGVAGLPVAAVLAHNLVAALLLAVAATFV